MPISSSATSPYDSVPAWRVGERRQADLLERALDRLASSRDRAPPSGTDAGSRARRGR